MDGAAAAERGDVGVHACMHDGDGGQRKARGVEWSGWVMASHRHAWGISAEAAPSRAATHQDEPQQKQSRHCLDRCGIALVLAG